MVSGTTKLDVGSRFSLNALLQEQLSYVQSEHVFIEPRKDSFEFCVTDSFNESPVVEMSIAIQVLFELLICSISFVYLFFNNLQLCLNLSTD